MLLTTGKQTPFLWHKVSGVKRGGTAYAKLKGDDPARGKSVSHTGAGDGKSHANHQNGKQN